jgi:hypothetical protein
VYLHHQATHRGRSNEAFLDRGVRNRRTVWRVRVFGLFTTYSFDLDIAQVDDLLARMAYRKPQLEYFKRSSPLGLPCRKFGFSSL